jgi:hypothetical protein
MYAFLVPFVLPVYNVFSLMYHGFGGWGDDVVRVVMRDEVDVRGGILDLVVI